MKHLKTMDTFETKVEDIKVNEKLTSEKSEVKEIIMTLNEIGVDGETMQFIVEQVGMDYQLLRQLIMTYDLKIVKQFYEERLELEK